MKSELFHIGPLTIYGYGFMIAVGVLAAWLVAAHRAKKQKLSEDHVFYLVICCVIGGILGAKLLFWITEFGEIIQDPSVILDTLSDGFVVYGGIIGGIFAGWLYCRIRRIEFLRYFDLVMPSVALAQGFGRIGCLLAGCCYGKETVSMISITFLNSDFAPNGVSLIPTQIYSSILDFLHFFLLLFLAKRVKKLGIIAGCYLIFYSIGRFVLEFYRGDFVRGSVGILSTSQFISIFMAAAGAALLLIFAKKTEP